MVGGRNEIFVALASYREPELRLTIESCLSQADHPERLVFGVCLQHEADGPPEIRPDCLDGLDANIRMLSFDYTESKGGCWARHLTQSLYDGEAYTLQIDAHARMEPSWDTDLIAMMQRFPGDKPLISGFPPLYTRSNDVDVFPDHDRSIVPVTLIDQWSSEGWIWHPTKAMAERTSVPRPTRVLSGAFVFTVGEWNDEVRQDPEHLYNGEELALTIRSFTSGYDLYDPSKVVVWHRAHPVANPKYIHDAPTPAVQRRHNRAMKRLRTLFAGDIDRILAPYSVGSARTVNQFSEWSGLDLSTMTASSDAIEGVDPPLSATAG